MDAILIIVGIATVNLVAALLYRRRTSQRAAATTGPGCWGPGDKPQRRFKHVLADNSYRPFKHLHRAELHDKDTSLKVHPYEKEIKLLLEQTPTIMKTVTIPECPHMDASYVWVHTEQQLEFLARLLSKEKVFAVDTEQHSVRSFLGFTALMQVSTEREDFLIDTIALHDVMSILRPVFADPAICKVFHGSDSDVLWLQRDFHIYVVNMFDTAKACEVLSKPYKSLAYLLGTYCRISTDKTFQLEDWRQRPLSQDMIHYARCDAHYLLYIAYCLTSELQTEIPAFSDEKYNEACLLSNKTCLKLYDKEIESSLGGVAASIYSRYCDMQGNTYSNSCAVKDRIWKMCAWRDLMARIHDESLRYVLSDEVMVALAGKSLEEPIEVDDITAETDSTCDSSSIKSRLSSPSPIVSYHLNEIFHLLQEMDANIDEELMSYLRKHLSPSGCCPLSIYNFALSSEFILRGKNTLLSKQCGGKLVTPGDRKDSRELCVKRPLHKPSFYMDCRIYTSDGKLVCYCRRKRLQWYVDRKLGTYIDNDPRAIMLNFDPKGCYADEDALVSNNLCVGCGENNLLRSFRVIPSCYKIHFPKYLKVDRKFDTVPLCINCHERATCAAETFKKQIADEFRIPLCVQRIEDKGKSVTPKLVCGYMEDGSSHKQLRSAATVLRHFPSLPPKKRDELMQIVKKYFGGREISAQDLETASHVGLSPCDTRKVEKRNKQRFKQSGSSAIPIIYESTCPETIESSSNVIVSSDVLGQKHHGKQVVQQLLHTNGEDGIHQFLQKWRQLFMEAVCPRFLPSGWYAMHG